MYSIATGAAPRVGSREGMNEDIRALIDGIRRGQYEDAGEKIALLAAAMLEQATDPALVVHLLQAPQEPLRRAVLAFLEERPEAVPMPEILRRLNDTSERVRTVLARILGRISGSETTEALGRLATDSSSEVRESAVEAAAGNPALTDVLLGRLASDSDWSVRQQSAKSLAGVEITRTATGLLRALGTDSDADVRGTCAEQLETALAAGPEGGGTAWEVDAEVLPAARKQVAAMERVPRLKAWLTSNTDSTVDPRELARFGTDLTTQSTSGSLARGFRLERAVETLAARLSSPKPRSVALIGRSGTGKTTLVHELVRFLARPENGAWRVVRMSPTDFMAGTRYVGDWETKVAELIEAVRRPRRVLLYIPNLSDLAAMGRWSKSDANVATALAPYLEDRSLVILGESTLDEFERGLGSDLTLRRLFDRVLVEEPTVEETRGILMEVRGSDEALLADSVLVSLQEMGEAFLGHLARPGSSVPLLRAVLAAAHERGRPVTRRDVLETLSVSTGIPADLLDDATPLDPATMASFFQGRILGQDEAVAAVADTVTLIKAGLNDPQKPFAVLLFVGPTGVGKTELARALAEYIFGDPARLQRFDMSEFAGPDGFVRLIGGRGENGLLTDAVTQRPFSVVLLDEIEKSHLNVFDLLLQLFDAGRLTDGRGRTVDFRRTIVILTSNVGAESTSAPLGFGRQADRASADGDRTFKELSRFFRPEFLNRIDRIVEFKALTLETAEKIARRELELVLQRSGIRRRGLAVTLSPEVNALLVREGYSRQFGARPIKRTVERLALLPLARALAAGGAEPGSLVHLHLRDDAVSVSVTRPPESPAVPSSKVGGGRKRGRNPVEMLGRRILELMPLATPLLDSKSRLVDSTRTPDFHRDAVARARVFDEIGRIDRFASRIAAVRDGIVRLQSDSETTDPAEALAELESEVEHLEKVVVAADDPAGLADAFVLIVRVQGQGNPIEAVDSLMGTYLGTATRRRFEGGIVGTLDEPRQDAALLEISGLGAAGLFRNEAGLHEFHRRRRTRNPRNGREETQDDSTLVRVEVVPELGEPPARFATLVRLKAVEGPPSERLGDRPVFRITGFHEASIRSLSLDFPGPRTEALERAARYFHALVESKPGSPPDGLIRRYDIGIGSRIKDLRTGRTTSRLAQFFRGRIDLPEGAPE